METDNLTYEAALVELQSIMDALQQEQDVSPEKTPIEEGGAGHGCGHNLFGAGSLGAAVAIKELIAKGELSGTIRFYGTPAEEKYFGKLYMARAGMFDDLDVCLDWHPSSRIEADVQSSLALVDFVVEFRGQAAHAAGDPWNGRSASDAMELMSAGINAYREHIRPTVRIHTHMQQAGDVVNVVPDYARMWVRVRDSKREGMMPVWKRVEEIAQGAAIMANVDYEITLVSGLHEVLPNRTGGAAMHANLEMLGPIEYTEAEAAFGRGIQRATEKPLVGIDGSIQPFKETRENPGGGSTDVGDGGREYFTQVRIILDMDGGGYADTLSLINQNGWNCNGDVYGLSAGDSLIVSLPYAEVTTWPEELEGVPPYPTFDLFGCGVYYLHVVDGILGGGENQEAVQLEAFLNDPFNNCPIILSAEEADPFSAVEVGPNPVSEELQIINFTREEIYFELYTINGQPLSSLTLRADQVGKLPMEDLPAGVYILRQQAAQSEQSKLIVKS
eukprot:g234.t1